MIEEKCLNKADIILYLILNSYFLTMASETPNETYKACFKNAVNELNKNIENGPQPTQRNYTKMINIVST